ncbi:MAG TPA: MBL fold metallo-hydrolase [Armatimonadota bacterium]|jgi:phosphoribosyl 1,2-cyclic phosphate phosphodiesterase
MTLTFLGTGTSSGVPVIGCDCAVCTSGDPRNTRYRASVWLRWDEISVVVDTGPEFRLQALRAGIRTVDALLLTHDHADHIFGLDDVRFFQLRGRREMPLYGDARTVGVIRRAFKYIFDGPLIPGTFRPTLAPHDVEGPFSLFGRTVIPIPICHGQLPILGYRIGGCAYLTDCSRIPEGSEALLQGLDVLVLGALRHRPHPTHFSLPQAVAAAQRLNPRRTYFTHIGHELDHEATERDLPAGFHIAYDGLTLDIE